MSRYACAPVTLSSLLDSVDMPVDVSRSDVVISGVSQDSRIIEPGDMYCCVRGENFDGHSFINDALAAGARALVVDSPDVQVPDDIAVVTVADVRSFLGPLASAFFHHPSRSLRMVGVTGTNGKTSTAIMIGSLLTATGAHVKVMGTLTGVRTTPEALDLHAQLRAWVNESVDVVVMEVSSHALVQHRVDGIIYDVAVFTNIGRDHLDFHGTEEAYFAAKAILFAPNHARCGVVNLDDPKGSLLNDVSPIPLTTFSKSDASNVVLSVNEISYTSQGLSITVPMGGEFTLMNSLAALATGRTLGVSDVDLQEGLRCLQPIPGRFESVPNELGLGVVVDYAHTPESLESLLVSARRVCRGRLILVFGCGGNRDAGKRPLMGGVASALADYVIVTSDNPRHEDPDRIIDEIFSGVPNSATHVSRESDRARAIASAISSAERGDIVVIAGKGHESTQDIAGVLHPFLDADVARQCLAQREETTE